MISRLIDSWSGEQAVMPGVCRAGLPTLQGYFSERSSRRQQIAGSRRRLGQQFGQPDQIIGRHGEGELPADLGQSAMPYPAQPGHCFGPAEGFFDGLRMRWETAYPEWRVVRRSIAERRAVVF